MFSLNIDESVTNMCVLSISIYQRDLDTRFELECCNDWQILQLKTSDLVYNQ